MLVYQLMPAKYALEDLRKRRLKVALVEDLNDPFELMGARLDRSEHRKQIREWRSYMAGLARLLCFSKKYMNPLMWSHYADKHRGMCLAFEVPKHLLLEVNYDPARLAVDFETEAKSPNGVSHETVQKLLATKFADWRYEDEIRMFIRPTEVVHDGGFQFFPFGNDLSLRAVYLGPRCTINRNEIEDAIQLVDRPSLVHATRLAFKSFRVIRTPWPARHNASSDA